MFSPEVLRRRGASRVLRVQTPLPEKVVVTSVLGCPPKGLPYSSREGATAGGLSGDTEAQEGKHLPRSGAGQRAS